MSLDEDLLPDQKGRLDSPRKVMEWAMKKYGWNEMDARAQLGLPEKERHNTRPQPDGGFVSTGNAKIDALLKKTLQYSDKAAPIVIDPELARDRAGDIWWHWRERVRFDKNLMKPPRMAPHFLGNLPRHQDLGTFFVYLCPTDPDKIVYTPDADHGWSDRRVVTTVGRFLVKHFREQLTDAQIKKIAEEHRSTYSNPTVHFAFTDADCAEVYLKGPGSCMGQKSFGSVVGKHPAIVYGGPDTVLAFLKVGGKISARAVCDIRSSPMLYSRIYGDEALLASRLQAFGFKYHMGLKDGVRLQLEEHPTLKRIFCPYLDNTTSVGPRDGFLVIGGGQRCQNTHGFCGSETLGSNTRFGCAFCGRTRDEGGNQAVDHHGSPICASCIAVEFVSAIYDRYGARRWVRLSESVALDKDVYYRHEELLKKYGYEYSLFHDQFYKASSGRIKLAGYPGSSFEAKELCTPAEHTTQHPIKGCLKAYDGRYVLVTEAKSVKKDGKIVYFHPKNPPPGVVKVGASYKVVAEMETA